MNGRDPIERSVLEILARQLRIATQDQLIRGLEQSRRISARATLALLRRLKRRGLVCSQLLPIALPELSDPVASWRLGQPAPDFNAVAWAVAKRLAAARPQRQQVYWASPLATRRVGGVGGRLRSPLQIEHDLGVTELFFARQRSDITTAARWLGEDAYARLRRPGRGQKKPDAVLLAANGDLDGRIEIVLDYLSLYPPARLRSFHRYWSARNTRYEWW